MLIRTPAKVFRRRRSMVVIVIVLASVLFQLYSSSTSTTPPPSSVDVLSSTTEGTELARTALEQLPVKGRAPNTGYSRAEFSDGWALVGTCDMRNIILKRSLTSLQLGSDDCTVLSGVLADPYTGKMINFVRGNSTSDDVQIDHVVALSDAWQKGAQSLTPDMRYQLANDPLELLAVDGPANQEKGDADAASWLPPNKSFRCAYVARQIAVKRKYSLWVTEAEKSAMLRVLNGCGEQVLPS